MQTPFENIMKLLEHSAEMKEKKKKLIDETRLLESGDINMQTMEEIEKREEEIDFLSKYSYTLESQAIVIMNEHNVINLPTMEDIEKNVQLRIE